MLIKLGRKDRSEVRRSYIRLLYDLRHLRARVKVYIMRINERINLMRSKARNELNEELRDNYLRMIKVYEELIKRLKYVDLLLEYLMLRIETLSLLEMPGYSVILIKKLLLNIRNYISELPDVSLIVEDLIERCSDLESIITPKSDVTFIAEKDAEKIISEAKELLKGS